MTNRRTAAARSQDESAQRGCLWLDNCHHLGSVRCSSEDARPAGPGWISATGETLGPGNGAITHMWLYTFSSKQIAGFG